MANRCFGFSLSLAKNLKTIKIITSVLFRVVLMQIQDGDVDATVLSVEYNILEQHVINALYCAFLAYCCRNFDKLRLVSTHDAQLKNKVKRSCQR